MYGVQFMFDAKIKIIVFFSRQLKFCFYYARIVSLV